MGTAVFQLVSVAMHFEELERSLYSSADHKLSITTVNMDYRAEFLDKYLGRCSYELPRECLDKIIAMCKSSLR